jgi:hypothetical protein
MFMSDKKLILLITAFFINLFTLAQENRFNCITNNNALERVCQVLQHISENKYFPKQMDEYFLNREIDSFASLIPYKLKKYSNKISFIGEFLRFLRLDIVGNTAKNLKTFTIQELSSNVGCFSIANGQVKHPIELKTLDNSTTNVKEFLATITTISREKNDKNKWDLHIERKYLYIEGLYINGKFKIHLPSILTNNNFPLQSKENNIGSIPEKLIEQYQDWLLSQEKLYMNSDVAQ